MRDPEELDCEEVLRVVFAYVDEELEAHVRARVDAHLERCRSCFSRAEFERRLKTRLAGTAEEAASARLEGRIRTLLDRFASDSRTSDPSAVRKA